MPMSHNTFGLGTVPPPPPPPMPGYLAAAAGTARQVMVGDAGQCSVAAGIIGGVIASAAAAVITVQARDTTAATPNCLHR